MDRRHRQVEGAFLAPGDYRHLLAMDVCLQALGQQGLPFRRRRLQRQAAPRRLQPQRRLGGRVVIHDPVAPIQHDHQVLDGFHHQVARHRRDIQHIAAQHQQAKEQPAKHKGHQRQVVIDARVPLQDTVQPRPAGQQEKWRGKQNTAPPVGINGDPQVDQRSGQ